MVQASGLESGVFRVEVTSTLKMEVIQSSEVLVTTYKTTQHLNPEDHNEIHHHENLKSLISTGCNKC
jgi:hypothetical protein